MLSIFPEKTLWQELYRFCQYQGLKNPEFYLDILLAAFRSERMLPDFQRYHVSWNQPYSSYPDEYVKQLFTRIGYMVLQLHRQDNCEPGSAFTNPQIIPYQVMEEIKKTHFKTLRPGSVYQLPTWKVVPGTGIVPTDDFTEISFVRGSQDPDESAERQVGVVHEALIAMQITDLEIKDNLVPDPFTKLAIANLKTALTCLGYRSLARKDAGVAGTYQPQPQLNSPPVRIL
jgi:hypothetical protein